MPGSPKLLHDRRGTAFAEWTILVVAVAIMGIAAFRLFGTRAQAVADVKGDCIASMTSCAPTSDGTPVVPSRSALIAAAASNPAGDVDDGEDPEEAPPTPSPQTRNIVDRGWDFTKGVAVDGVWGTLTGMWDAVTDPVGTFEGLVYLVQNPAETAEALKKQVERSWERNPERTTGAGAFEIATLPFPILKIGKLGKIAKLAKLAEALKLGKLPAEFVEAIAALPRAVDKAFGHGLTKHGPKTADEIAQLAKGDFKGKSITHFTDAAAMERAAATAADALGDVLKTNPEKAALFADFLLEATEGARFGFVFDVGQVVGSGFAKVDGKIVKLENLTKVYVEYVLTKGPNGTLVPKIKTIYPKA